MTSVPKETCELKPLKICTNEIVSYPVLQLVNECVDVPKEVCSLEKVNPRQVARPIVKKWCPDENKNVAVVTEAPNSELWGPWSDWTACPEVCGNQTRYRKCLDETDDCPNFEEDSTQTQPCPCKQSLISSKVLSQVIGLKSTLEACPGCAML